MKITVIEDPGEVVKWPLLMRHKQSGMIVLRSGPGSSGTVLSVGGSVAHKLGENRDGWSWNVLPKEWEVFNGVVTMRND